MAIHGEIFDKEVRGCLRAIAVIFVGGVALGFLFALALYWVFA